MKIKRSKFLVLGILLATVAIAVITDDTFNFGKTDITHIRYPIVIDPASDSVGLNESKTFTSKAITASGPVPVKSIWTIDNTVPAKQETDCANGTQSTTCTITSIIPPASDKTPTTITPIKLTATAPEGQKDARVLVHNIQTIYPNSDYFMEPGTYSFANQGAAVTFVTKKKLPGATATVEVKSDWSISSGQENIETGKCEGSRCTLFTKFSNGTKTPIYTFVKAKPKDSNETLYSLLDISDAVISPFSDTIPDWAKQGIVALSSRGIINGYPSGKYGPDDPVTRGQWILLLQRFATFKQIDLSGVDISNCNLTDVPADHYAREAICIGQKLNWLDIDSKTTTFRPDDSLKRSEAATILFNTILSPLIKPDTTIPNPYTDIKSTDSYYSAVIATKIFNIISGYPDGTFKPDNILNRAEAATILWRTHNATKNS